MDRQAVEHVLDVWRGKFRPPHQPRQATIPVTVHVEWADGGEGGIDGRISQWTRDTQPGVISGALLNETHRRYDDVR
jgi:hypothetical protein